MCDRDDRNRVDPRPGSVHSTSPVGRTFEMDEMFVGNFSFLFLRFPVLDTHLYGKPQRRGMDESLENLEVAVSVSSGGTPLCGPYRRR